jgi:ABC-type multidrug transport system fused ATPase/permease subunit
LAQLAARRIKALRILKPAIESSWNDPDAQVVDLLQGTEEKQSTPLIEFKNVGFSYPLAPDTPVLKDLNLKIHKGQFVAFTGSSGCGKSTAFGLIERYANMFFVLTIVQN